MSPHSPSSDRLLVVAILASHFGPPFMFSGVAVALPAMGRDLGAGATALGLVETLFLAGNLAFLLPAGRLADASGRAALFRLGLVGFVVTSLLMTALPWVWAVLALRFAQGMASAAFSATSTALLAELVPLERRGRAFGTSLGIVYTGLTVGPVLAGVLVDLVGWRAVFVFSGLLSA